MIFVVSHEMQNFKDVTCTDFPIHLSRVVITIAHIYGAAPFP